MDVTQKLRFRRSRPREVTTAWSPGVSLIWHADEGLYYENPRNRFCYFRKTFELAALVEFSELRIIADTKYLLYVNGTEIGRGPSRFDPRWAYYDIYDVSSHLVEGDNVIAVLVLYHGYGTGAQASLIQTLLVDARIELANGATVTIVTDTSWHARIADAYDERAPRLNGRQGPMEVVDLRRIPVGWTEPDFDDGTWAPTVIMRPGVRNIPWFNLVPRDIPFLAEGQAIAQTLVGQGWGEGAAPQTPALGAIRDRITWTAAPDAGSQPFPEGGMVLPGRGPDEATVVNLDLGQGVVGYLEIDVVGSAGTVVDALYAEALWEGLVPAGHASRVPTDRFTLRDGPQEARVLFGWKAFRYVQLWIWSEAPVTLQRVRVRTVGYPLPQVSLPQTSDRLLDRILENADRTLRMCMQDGFLDSPSREQQQWMGDGGRQALTAAYMFGDPRLWRRLLQQIGQSQDWTGALLPRHPGRHENVSPIPQFMLDWVTSHWDYYRFTGDDQLLRAWWPNLILVLRWFSAFENDVGLLEDVPHWMFIDWGGRPLGPAPDVGRGGIITALNLKYLGALRIAAEMATRLGDLAAREVYGTLADRLEQAIPEATWSEAKGAFVDCVVEGVQSEVISESANALALLNLPLSPAQQTSIVAHVFEVDGPEVNVVIASPYYTLEYGRALHAAGRVDLALARLRERFGLMLAQGATTSWEMWGLFNRYGSPPAIASASHGWGTAIYAVFVETILGVSFRIPGFQEVVVCPRSDLLATVSTQVCTPHGGLGIAWQVEDGTLTCEMLVPDGLRGTLVLPNGETHRLEPGRTRWRVAREGKDRAETGLAGKEQGATADG